MPDEYGFNHLPRHGNGDLVSCIHKGCEFKGPIWRMKKEIRLRHSLEHFVPSEVPEGAEFKVSPDGLRVQNCRTCGNEFSQERRRGRPRLECENCKPSL